MGYFENEAIIARNGGSPQARHENCPICDSQEDEEEGDDEEA